MIFFQAEDGIRDLVRSRGLGDVYKRQVPFLLGEAALGDLQQVDVLALEEGPAVPRPVLILSLIHI